MPQTTLFFNFFLAFYGFHQDHKFISTKPRESRYKNTQTKPRKVGIAFSFPQERIKSNHLSSSTELLDAIIEVHALVVDVNQVLDGIGKRISSNTKTISSSLSLYSWMNWVFQHCLGFFKNMSIALSVAKITASWCYSRSTPIPGTA